MKKLLCLALSVVTIVCASLGVTQSVFANDVYNIEIGTDVEDYVYIAKDGSTYRVHQYDFEAPANGKVTLTFYGFSGDSSSKKQRLKCSFYKRGKNAMLKEFKTKLDATQTGAYYSIAKKTYSVKRGPTYGFGMAPAYYDTGIQYTVTFKYKPNAPKIKALTSKKRRARVKWSTVKGVTGYTIQYSRSKNFKKKTTVMTYSDKDYAKYTKKLKKGKKYYFRVRSFVIQAGQNSSKTYNSKWSAKKSIVIK